MGAAFKMPPPEETDAHVEACRTNPATLTKLRDKTAQADAIIWLVDHGLASEWPRPEKTPTGPVVAPFPQGLPTMKYIAEQAKANRPKARARMTCLRDVDTEQVEWLWPGRIPVATVSLIAGDPGAGKSTLTRSLITTVTTGGCWPDQEGAHADPGCVVLLTAEENLATVVRPALEKMGADVDKVHVLETIEREDGHLSPFSMMRDVPLLEEAITALEDAGHPVRMVIIDPIGDYVSGTDSHNDSEVREALNPLFKMAERHHLAVVLIAHLNKGGGTNVLYRISGSIGFVGKARMVWFYSKHPHEKGQRILSYVKGNFPEITRTAITNTLAHGQVLWDAEPVEWDSDDVARLLQVEGERFKSTAKKGRKPKKTSEAKEFLVKLLANGDACLFSVAAEKGLQLGFAEATLRVACDRLEQEGKITRSKTPADPRVWLKMVPGSDALPGQPPLPGMA